MYNYFIHSKIRKEAYYQQFCVQNSFNPLNYEKVIIDYGKLDACFRCL